MARVRALISSKAKISMKYFSSILIRYRFSFRSLKFTHEIHVRATFFYWDIMILLFNANVQNSSRQIQFRRRKKNFGMFGQNDVYDEGWAK